MHNRISRAESLCTVYNVCESCKCVSDEFCLPLWHSTSGRPVCPGRQRQTKNACSRMHSAFLPHPSVLQSTTFLSSTVPASTATLHPKNHTDKTSLTFDGRITSWSLRWTETLSLFSTHNPALCSDSAQFLFAQIHRLGVADAPLLGSPTHPGIQLHSYFPSTSLHLVFAPQGFFKHSSFPPFLHSTKAFPMKPGGQEQCGFLSITRH
jgi:hypothetical protein